ncbi:glycosyltransferase family 2 protein [Candidatus Pelagibacter sp.]|jgi:glycosyltransferase involved in cell wall biosynthesis|nr:glycosyltransferase family 2 protein [Candidatus Pelagibacter sp.]
MKKIKILIPVYNDWQSVFKLLENIDNGLEAWDSDVAHISVIIVNDASTEERPINIFTFKSLKSIKVINMKSNNGHARCIATGLKYISKNTDFDLVIPMDSDGEDRPEELGPLLCKAYEHPNQVVTANRVKRSEGVTFKFCYLAHKYLTFIFTGQSIKFGNFTSLPKLVVNEMINESATWSSFSGSLAKIAKNRKSIPSERGTRYFGPSKMSFINLLKHSLSIIAVFKIRLLIRSAIFLIAYLFLIIGKISIITLIPFIGVVAMMLSVIILSKRENMSEFNNSLDNIKEIEKLK